MADMVHGEEEGEENESEESEEMEEGEEEEEEEVKEEEEEEDSDHASEKDRRRRMLPLPPAWTQGEEVPAAPPRIEEGTENEGKEEHHRPADPRSGDATPPYSRVDSKGIG